MHFDELINQTSLAHLEELFEGPTEWRLREYQAEIWVPGSIPRVPTDYFNEVWFVNEDAMSQGAELCRDLRSSVIPPFTLGHPWFRR